MKKVLVILMVVFLFFSCDANKHYYGLLNEEDRMEDVEYQLSGTNILIGAVLFEMALVPTVVVGGWYLYESVEDVR